MSSVNPSELTEPRRLPRLEDFPETGPNALATFQQRGFSRVADELIVWFPLTIIVSSVRAAQASGTDLASEAELPLAVLVGVFAVQIVYEVVAVAIWGQTVGKWLTGIRVARYTDGGRPTVAQALLRCLLWAAPAAAGLVVLPFAPLAGALPVFLSAWRYPLRRAWHDEAGGTIVVRTR
jgi:uncharacterized RDD family membrane protein YckC